jgi:teichuronic acid biosynthesis glycosyltransferase TuaC
VNILTFTSLYPNAVNPQHGIFVETRLRQLVAHGDVTASVIAPIPWFPLSVGPFRRYAEFAAAPVRETRHEIDIHHPRFLTIPKIGMSLTPASMARASRRLFRDIVETGKVDLIDAHYFYPDGVAAAMLAAEIGIPCVITGRGTDLNVFPEFPAARRKILQAVDRAAACITVSEALRDRLVEIGAPADKVTTLRNGVDLDLFAPAPDNGDDLRQRLEIMGHMIVAVGNLAPEKGQRLIVEALRALPEVTLVLVGAGPDAAHLAAAAQDFGVADRVQFAGRVPQADLAAYFSAADVSVLASAREGWPNVLLESMACGTPVVATDVGGVREIVTSSAAGTVVADRTPQALAEAISKTLAALPDRAQTRAHAEKFGWDDTTNGQIELFQNILSA